MPASSGPLGVWGGGATGSSVEPVKPMPRRPQPPSRSTRALRWVALAVVVAIAVAYVQPIRAYFDASGKLAERRAERSSLLRQQTELLHRLELTETDAFIEREARRLGLVRPGEHLFIVAGLEDSAEPGLP
jgi:hypothetical protein